MDVSRKIIPKNSYLRTTDGVFAIIGTVGAVITAILAVGLVFLFPKASNFWLALFIICIALVCQVLALWSGIRRNRREHYPGSRDAV